MATAVELLREIRKTSKPNVHLHEFLEILGREECVSCRHSRADIEEAERFSADLLGRVSGNR